MSGIRIALIGYGKMGTAIRERAELSGFTISAVIDPLREGCLAAVTPEALAGTDVCMEFTAPEQAVHNIILAVRAGCSVVTGTTGWSDRIEEIRPVVSDAGVGVVHASNYSLGVLLFRRMVRVASKLVAPHVQYDVAIEETHHRMKRDAPSGTALDLADDVLDGGSRKRGIAAVPSSGTLDPELLYVSSTRVGHVPGTHRVIFDGPADSIVLTHTARGRQALAEGALLAARWIHGKKGLFTMEDVLDDLEHA